MIEVKEGYKLVCCPTHKHKVIGQVRIDSEQNGEVLIFCKLCNHVVPVINRKKQDNSIK